MSPADRKIVSRLLVAGIAVLAIGLSGCGRKAALDPPPGAAVTTKTAPCTTCAPAPKGPDKPFFLDWLL